MADIDFPAVLMPQVQMNVNKNFCIFVFEDLDLNRLRVKVPEELGAHIVAQMQAQFISLAMRRRHGAASDQEAAGEFLSIALRVPRSAEAKPAIERYNPLVQLQIDAGSEYELNYGLDPDQAEDLARQLQEAASLVRADSAGRNRI